MAKQLSILEKEFLICRYKGSVQNTNIARVADPAVVRTMIRKPLIRLKDNRQDTRLWLYKEKTNSRRPSPAMDRR